MVSIDTQRTDGLPDPEYDREMYRDVPAKRLFAWIIDIFVILVLSIILSVFTAFTALLFFPFFYALVSFFYRWGTIAVFSGTPGMRMMAIGLRGPDGHRLTTGQAFLHTTGYFISFAVFPLQLVSIAMMFLSERNQGLSDVLLGTAALNRSTN